jgi:hypothetical protein
MVKKVIPILSIFSVLLLTIGNTTQAGEEEIGRPDLVIERVTYAKKPSTFMSGGPVPMPVGVGGLMFDFTLFVKNIGTGSFSDELYVFYTRSNEEFENKYYTGRYLAESVQGVKPCIISPNEVVEVKLPFVNIDQDIVRVRFFIRGVLQEDNAESKLDNNTYELKIENKW